jgi:hypothetical protein
MSQYDGGTCVYCAVYSLRIVLLHTITCAHYVLLSLAHYYDSLERWRASVAGADVQERKAPVPGPQGALIRRALGRVVCRTCYMTSTKCMLNVTSPTWYLAKRSPVVLLLV